MKVVEDVVLVVRVVEDVVVVVRVVEDVVVVVEDDVLVDTVLLEVDDEVVEVVVEVVLVGVSVDVLILVLVTVLVEDIVLVEEVVVVEEVVGVGASTTTRAVSPVGATVNPSLWAVALLKYSPGSDDTVTEKCRLTLPAFPFVAPGTTKGPDQVSVCPTTLGSAVVSPCVEPAT